MLNVYDILETIRMIQDECLDIRTITMGMRSCRGCHRQLRLDPKALRIAVIAYASVVYFLAVDL